MYKSIIQLLTFLAVIFQASPSWSQDVLASLINKEGECSSAHEGAVYKEVEEMPSLVECSKSGDSALCTSNVLEDVIISDRRFQNKLMNSQTFSSTLVSFIVEPDGCLTNFNVRRDGCSGCGHIISDILKKDSKWVPGMTNGHKVRVMKSFMLDHVRV